MIIFHLKLCCGVFISIIEERAKYPDRPDIPHWITAFPSTEVPHELQLIQSHPQKPASAICYLPCRIQFLDPPFPAQSLSGSTAHIRRAFSLQTQQISHVSRYQSPPSHHSLLQIYRQNSAPSNLHQQLLICPMCLTFSPR